MEERILNAAIAGLLHDIGKLEQRARDDPWNNAPGIEREGQPVHATWTIYFAETYLPKEFRAAALAGAYHHNPAASPAADKYLSKLVALADKLSAGERSDSLDETTKETDPPRQMVSIFDRVSLSDQAKTSDWNYLPIRPSSLDQAAIFPMGKAGRKEEIRAYAELTAILRKGAQQPIASPVAYLENLQNLLRQTCWSVPSAYYHSIPDVSLYDHSRMTAAIAVCLAELQTESVDRLLGAVTQDFQGKGSKEDHTILAEPAALLVGGDISGIQDFIYTISPKGAAKMLRGRSFYIQLLTEAVLRYMLEQLGLTGVNIIYSGGGHFYFLAPLGATEKINLVRKTISEKLLKHHGVNLYLATASVEIPPSGFRKGRFPTYWSALQTALSAAKSQRYNELGQEFYASIFELPEFGNDPKNTCDICGDDSRPVSIWEAEREEQATICPLCKSFSDEIGKKLPHSQFIALGFSQPTSKKPGSALDVLAEFGMRIQFITDASAAVTLNEGSWTLIWSFSDPKEDRWPSAETAAAHSIHYFVNTAPDMSFDKLQDKVSGGYKRLGVLRMDVDNLGEIFRRGFGDPASEDNLATLARLSTLSHQIAMFFEGWVKKLCEEISNTIYAVYAGGDDLFLIGPWDIMPKVAQRVCDDFCAYTAGNPDLHISGGMAFIGGKYPVYLAANDAHQAEKQAKDIPGKDAFSFLGQAWHWPVFIQIEEKQQRLEKIVGRDSSDPDSLKGPQAIIQILRELAADEAEKSKQIGARPVWGAWMWLGPYRLTRMAERQKEKNPQLASAIKQLRDDLDQENYQQINQWGSAARWTQLIIRKEQRHE